MAFSISIITLLRNGFPTFSRQIETCPFRMFSPWLIGDLLLRDKFVAFLANDKKAQKMLLCNFKTLSCYGV